MMIIGLLQGMDEAADALSRAYWRLYLSTVHAVFSVTHTFYTRTENAMLL